MPRRWSRRGPAFSLLELILVVAVIALLAVTAIPRLSRGTKGAANSALAGSLAALRDAIDRYAAEHGGKFPQLADVEKQLTRYTNSVGATKPKKDATYIWGPYLRRIPPLPVGVNKGKTGIRQVDEGDAGWIYDPTTGTIRANCLDMEVDDAGKKYRDY